MLPGIEIKNNQATKLELRSDIPLEKGLDVFDFP